LIALAADRVAHGEKTGDCRVEHGVADQEVRVVADPRRASDVGEEKDLEDRRQHEHRDENPRREPGEERPVAGQPTDEEDAK
jgi:hypothetical protein